MIRLRLSKSKTIVTVRTYLSYCRYFERGGTITFSLQDYSLGILKLNKIEIFFVKIFEILLKIKWKVQKRSSLNLNDEQKNIFYRFQAKATSLSPELCRQLFNSALRQNLQFSAQFAQDIMAYLFFVGKKNGFYIEIRANEGYGRSTTFWAELLGWKGIHLKSAELCGFGNTCVEFPEHIDFLAMHVCKMNVLQSIDFDNYSFGLITIETAENSDIVKFLEQSGYKVLLTAGSDVRLSSIVKLRWTKICVISSTIVDILRIFPLPRINNSNFIFSM